MRLLQAAAAAIYLRRGEADPGHVIAGDLSFAVVRVRPQYATTTNHCPSASYDLKDPQARGLEESVFYLSLFYLCSSLSPIVPAFPAF